MKTPQKRKLSVLTCLTRGSQAAGLPVILTAEQARARTVEVLMEDPADQVGPVEQADLAADTELAVDMVLAAEEDALQRTSSAGLSPAHARR